MKTDERKLNATRKYRKTSRGVLTNIYNKMKERKGPLSFSLKIFHEWSDGQERFSRLYNEWVASKYLNDLKPTVDRIDCFKGYEFDNMKFLTLCENRYKQRMEVKRIRARRFYQILNGKIVNVYKLQTEAAKMTGIHQGSLSDALNGRYKVVGGFEWSYENKELLEE